VARLVATVRGQSGQP